MEHGGIERIHRTGVDLDTLNQFQMLKKYFNAKRFSDDVRVFRTNHGYHIHIYTPDRSPEMNLHIRNMIGGCEGRMDLDDQRYMGKQYDLMETLYFNKFEDGERGGEILVDPLMNDWMMVKEQ